MSRYCVIGAGAAGLSALQKLRAAGYDVDCYEKTDRVGGHWNTDYDALHLITSRDMTHFEDFPMPADYPHFPRRDQVRAYLESYAEAHGLGDVIRFETPVASVRPIETEGPLGSAGWTVTLENGEVHSYDGVLVANGHLWDQKIPAVPGVFTGTQIHSGSYRNTGDISGDRVLVVGAGNSGCDLAVDAAQHRYDVDIVIRQGTYFQPKSYFGVPRQEVAWMAGFAPEEQDLISRLLARVSLGEWDAYPGLPQPKAKTLAEGRTVVNSLLLYWLQHGRVRVVPGITRFDGGTVHFSDGTSREYDTILWATGFHASLPFLDESLIARRGGTPLRYGGGVVPVGLEKLYYIGLAAPRGPQIPVYGEQTKLALRMIELHEQAGPRGAGLEEYLAELQEADDRIDIVRAVWNEQMADTARLLGAFGLARAAQPEAEVLESSVT
ncbi:MULTISPECIES: NAD(P)-binding domain-containing protein [unclassified Rathayibacter]|uniref:flavin-containing monooxygenase n=1 Tax=unclassified Rathayibacter TaxID=2609250 RepID=UPI0010432617|nr:MULTISPECIES: NAD(P)-binding domain-containing protein [unclassified Rathayibacter]TCL79433.1 cation diffusion facilitator CzcD-associated flavoprotein CzcO [Rathayibacter sp. PhB192]TCM25298.1 cation diffusion facilitator CzcD-associated flavoprotein CzcO [Rathayibacter sp. PhB179]